MDTLQYGKYYHIYNRGNNRENLFQTPDNYQYFLLLYEKYIFPIADTYAWVPMKNHFHLLIRIKEAEEILPSLFERPFHRKIITSDPHFRNMVIYIHTNPVHHGFTDNFKDYPWSSYGSIISSKPTKLSRDKVIGWFDDKTNFIETHRKKQNLEDIWDLLLE